MYFTPKSITFMIKALPWVIPCYIKFSITQFLITDWSNKNVTLNITSLKANEKDENSSSNNPPLIIKESITQSGILRRFIGMQLESNTHYSISLLVKNEKWLEIGQFQTGEKNRTAISVVFTCLFLLFLVILGFFVYKRYFTYKHDKQFSNFFVKSISWYFFY